MGTTVDLLKIGEKAIITHVDLDKIPMKLLEMGCLPGNELEVIQIAPFGDPIYYDLIINNIVKINNDGSIIINPIYFDYFNGRKTINKKFEENLKIHIFDTYQF